MEIPSMVAAMNNGPHEPLGVAARRLSQVYSFRGRYPSLGNNVGEVSNRGPVKNRLGVRPSERLQQTYRGGHGSRNFRHQERQSDGQRQWPRPDYSQMICNFCGIKGHIRKKCFKLKNLNRDAVNLVESYRPGPSADRHITEMLERMRTKDDDEDEDNDSDMFWKRGSNGPQDAAQDM
ncbi:uncharacterized protein LOC134223232 [Armigeres subalbatus]|uniref:uncharacterized protein LOC134223232 n=1 Tax=Armigeres subalbatus TaxID=124917 RepID=UPI002ED1FA44